MIDVPITVFRAKFDKYIQLVKAGETLAITRRGKIEVYLTPVQSGESTGCNENAEAGRPDAN